jgi:hypothetical protein
MGKEGKRCSIFREGTVYSFRLPSYVWRVLTIVMFYLPILDAQIQETFGEYYATTQVQRKAIAVGVLL